ncbi:MAG: hypothetical protein V7735_12920 [Photobacterium frigidiphilum]|uniref:hypothetical protein n=1 Tax=Photobacterium frigidiphilum TaxID=264736 RepID=UPI003001E9C8
MSVDVVNVEIDEAPSFDDISTKDFDAAISKLNSAISSQFFEVKNNSTLVVFNDVLSNDELEDNAKKILLSSNYEASALHGEIVVLFSNPLFISDLACTGNMFGDDNSKTIRLISGQFVEKKFISRNNVSHGGSNSIYKVNGTIRGVVLPPRTSFVKANAIDFHQFFADEAKLEMVMKAHQNVSLEAGALKQAMSNQTGEISNYLDEQLSDFNSLNNDINIALKEKERLENSNIQNSEILDRIQDDINKANDKLVSIQARENAATENLERLKHSAEREKTEVESQQAELNHVSGQIMDAKIERADLLDEIREAKKDINLTTLDMKGFSSESRKQLRYYYSLALAALAFLGVVFNYMYNNAKTFETLMDEKINLAPWDILLSRLPLITATALVVGTLSALLFYLVNHIISVNTDKMNMLKAAILAEQITGSLPSDDMTEEQIREYQRNTKIELVMNIFSGKPEPIKNDKQQDIIKQILAALKSGN